MGIIFITILLLILFINYIRSEVYNYNAKNEAERNGKETWFDSDGHMRYGYKKVVYGNYEGHTVLKEVGGPVIIDYTQPKLDKALKDFWDSYRLRKPNLIKRNVEYYSTSVFGFTSHFKMETATDKRVTARAEIENGITKHYKYYFDDILDKFPNENTKVEIDEKTYFDIVCY